MAVITVSRQLGSLGNEIAEEVAQRLGYRLVDREIIEEVAQRLGVPPSAVSERDEREGSVVADLVRTMRRLYPATYGNEAEEQAELDEAAYFNMVQLVISEVRHEGNAVIVGRGSTFCLGRDQDLLHVLIVAPLDVRVQRVMQREGLRKQRAAARVRDADLSRARYVRHFYRTDWLEIEHYDLVINTGHFNVAEATDVIVASLHSPTR